MDKKTESIQESLLSVYDVSFLSGSQAKDFTESVESGFLDEKKKSPGDTTENIESGVEGKIAHLSLPSQSDILEMSRIMLGHPVCAYISPDGLRAGIICSREWMHAYWDIFSRFSQCFFRSHDDICTVFGSELMQVGRKYGR